MLKNNSLNISSLISQNSNLLTSNLIQEISILFASFYPKFDEVMSSNQNIFNDLSSTSAMLVSLQKENSLISPSINLKFKTLFEMLKLDKKDLMEHFSDSLSSNWAKISDKILLIEGIISTSIDNCITSKLIDINRIMEENKIMIQSLLNLPLLNMNDNSNPFAIFFETLTSSLEQSFFSFSQPIETISKYPIQIFDISSLTYSNITLMSNRLIDFQSTFETKFNEFTFQLSPIISNTNYTVLNLQSEFLNSLPNSLNTLLSPLKTLNEIIPFNQNLNIFMAKVNNTLHDLVGKNDSILSYITNDNLLKKILNCCCSHQTMVRE
jgi:hypothetical protein